MVQLNPNDRPDIKTIINHPALLPFHVSSPLSAEEYQIMLRNYILNTQGSNNRNLPEEIEKFMNTYTELPHGAPDQHNEKLVISYAELNENEKQPKQQAEKGASQTILSSPVKEEFFDDISKVIQMEQSSSKANIFRKASAPRNVISQLIFSEEPQQNQKVEKMTNFFEAMYDPFTQTTNLVVPVAQFIDDPKVAKFMKSPNASYVEEMNQFNQNMHSFGEKNLVEYPTASTMNQTRTSPLTRDIISRIGQVDINDFSSSIQSNANVIKVQQTAHNMEPTSQNRNLYVKNLSSENDDRSKNHNYSKLTKEYTVGHLDKFTSDSGTTNWQESAKDNKLSGEQYRPPKLIVSALINRSIFSKHNLSDVVQPKPAHEPAITVQSPKFNLLSQPVTVSALNRSEERNIVNHMPVPGIGETRRKSSVSIEPMQFINAQLDQTPQLSAQPSVKIPQKLNDRSSRDSSQSKQAPITIKITTNTQQDYSSNSFTNPNSQAKEIQGTSNRNSMIQLSQILSVQPTFENANLKSSQVFYQYAEPKNAISVNYKPAKYPNSEVAQDKETKAKVHVSTEPSQFNKSNSMHALMYNSKPKKINSDDVRAGDRMFLPLEIGRDAKVSSFLPNMTTLHREINTGTTTGSNRSTVNAFVNHNDEDNSKYLQSLNYFSSARNVPQPSKQYDIDSMLDSFSRNEDSSRRVTEMSSINRTTFQINKPTQTFSSKIIKLPGSTQLPRRDN